MRSRTFLLAIAAALLVGAGPGASPRRWPRPPRQVPSQAPQAARRGRPAALHQRLPRQPRASGDADAARRRAHARGRGRVPGHAPRRAAQRRTRNTLVVSAGDNIGASPLVSGLFHDEPTIEAFNAMGVDISSVGNHEFDEGSAELLRMQDGGCHPVDGCQAATASTARTSTTSPPTWSTTTRARRSSARTRSAASAASRSASSASTLEGHAAIVTPVGRRGPHLRRRGRRDQQATSAKLRRRASRRSSC